MLDCTKYIISGMCMYIIFINYVCTNTDNLYLQFMYVHIHI